MTMPPVHPSPQPTPASPLDFRRAVNPYGPDWTLLQAVRDADHAALPDPAYAAARRALAGLHHVDVAGVVPGLGLPDLVDRLIRAIGAGDGGLAVLGDPWDDVVPWLAARGTPVHQVALPEPDGAGRSPLSGLALDGVKLLLVRPPEFRAGCPWDALAWHALAGRCAAAGAVLAVDDSLVPFTARPVPGSLPGLVRLRSPGEAHGLPGVRAAYALLSGELAGRVAGLAAPSALPAGTLAVLEALPGAAGFLHETLPRVLQHAGALAAALERFGDVQHAGGPVVALRLPGAEAARTALAARGLLLGGDEETLLACTRRPGEHAALVAALAEHLGVGRGRQAESPAPAGSRVGRGVFRLTGRR
ncbi:histidinol-phosphate aminotransferase family protein [Deinococcus enclensis]|uniref:Histidinol-phosphate aminotransferase n=1 Tax=Deinococcus enclensis TaxID=1049582 RepID=A0ABT9MBX3_9DEIO|nr:histidinol-phosphate aminotransferase family protein [Deinococcus enclensis]MDP9763991.1 histidinol-phosphate aminotransferase [Deinococcus enclensis]